MELKDKYPNIRMLQPTGAYTVQYPYCVDASLREHKTSWLPNLDVKGDVHYILTEMPENAKFGCIRASLVFTKYELVIGDEYWSNYVHKLFPRPADIQRMASTHSFVEVGSHAPFYAAINTALGLTSEEFYTSYLDDPILKDRMAWVGRRLSKRGTLQEVLKSLAVFSMIEGGVIFSTFAFFAHFNNNGNAVMKGINAGINYSVIEEGYHSRDGAWLFRQLLSEIKSGGYWADIDYEELVADLQETAKVIYEHESQINAGILAMGDLPGYKLVDANTFVQSCLNGCLERLGIEPVFTVEDCPVSKWFYQNTNGSTLGDFFDSHQSDYHRNYDKSKFSACWKK
jgi:ribonucleotide reductase beta subunit family protein with ferritin-like domain